VGREEGCFVAERGRNSVFLGKNSSFVVTYGGVLGNSVSSNME
jgi:hypothetical protein